MDKSNEDRIQQLEQQVYDLGYMLRELQAKVEQLERSKQEELDAILKGIREARGTRASRDPLGLSAPHNIHWVRMGTEAASADKPEDT